MIQGTTIVYTTSGPSYYIPSGFAHFRFSILPVFGQRISCQDTGSIVAPGSHHQPCSATEGPSGIGEGTLCGVCLQYSPASLVAKITPRSFRAVLT